MRSPRPIRLGASQTSPVPLGASSTGGPRNIKQSMPRESHTGLSRCHAAGHRPSRGLSLTRCPSPFGVRVAFYQLLSSGFCRNFGSGCEPECLHFIGVLSFDGRISRRCSLRRDRLLSCQLRPTAWSLALATRIRPAKRPVAPRSAESGRSCWPTARRNWPCSPFGQHAQPDAVVPISLINPARRPRKAKTAPPQRILRQCLLHRH